MFPLFHPRASFLNLSYVFFFSSRRRHTRFSRDWSSDVCSSDLECGDLIEQSVIPAGPILRFLAQLRMGHQPEYSQAVIDRYQDHALAGQRLSIETGSRSGALDESAAVTPYHHRATPVRRPRGRPYVQVKAILALRLLFGEELNLVEASLLLLGLYADRAEFRGIAHAVPGKGRPRRTPPQVPNGRRGIGDAPEDAHIRIPSILPCERS